MLAGAYRADEQEQRSKMADWVPKVDEDDEVLLTPEKQKVKPPKLWKVLIHNDDYTTMEFVVYVLESIFGKGPEEAKRIMLAVHQRGVGIAGVYTYEIAETKVDKTIQFAREKEFPLLCTMEEE